MKSIDDYDDEVGKEEKKEFRFTINFKKIDYMCSELIADNSIRDEEYPLNILIKMILGIWCGAAIFFCFSYSVILIVTLPILFFFFLAFLKVKSAWKEYQYPMGKFALFNIAGLIVSIGIAVLVQTMIFYT